MKKVKNSVIKYIKGFIIDYEVFIFLDLVLRIYDSMGKTCVKLNSMFY